MCGLLSEDLLLAIGNIDLGIGCQIHFPREILNNIERAVFFRFISIHIYQNYVNDFALYRI